MPRSLPTNPSIEHLQKEARSIIKAHRNGDAACCATLRYHFRFSRSENGEILNAKVTLQEAQHALALDYGFRSWGEMKSSILGGKDVSDTVTERQAESPFESLMSRGYAEEMKDPSIRAAMRAQQKAGLDSMYGSLFKDLNVTADELWELKELLIDRQMEFVEGGLDMLTNVSKRDEWSKWGNQIELIIGEQNYRTLRKWEETSDERVKVDIFKHSLAKGDQLEEEQELSLVAAMHQTRKRIKPSPGGHQKPATDQPRSSAQEMIAKRMDESALLNPDYIACAQDILTPSQLEQFKESLEQQLALEVMNIRVYGPVPSTNRKDEKTQ